MEDDLSQSKRTTVGGVGLAIALVAGFAFLPRVFAGQSDPLVGHDAPDFALPLAVNRGPFAHAKSTVSLSDLRGQAVLLDFWATWCGPCRAEAPIVDQISRRFRDQGVVVLGIDTDAPGQGDPAAFAAAHGLSYPIVHDEVGQASRSYGVESLPTLVVVSRTGKVIAVRTGMTEDTELERLVRQAL